MTWKEILRTTLANLDERKQKQKNVEENIAYLRKLLDEGKNIMDDYETKLHDKTKECSRIK